MVARVLVASVVALLGTGLPCGEPPPFRARVARQLDREVSAAELVVKLNVEATDDHYRGHARLIVRGVEYTRTLEAESCSALFEAVTLVAVASLDVSAEGEDVIVPAPPLVEDPDDAPVETVLVERPLPTPIVVPEASSDRRPPPPPPRKRPRAFIDVAAGVGVGGPSGVNGIVQLSVGVRHKWASAAVGGAYWLRRRATASRTDRQIVTELGTADVRGCAGFGRRIRAGPCLGVEVGGMRAYLTGAREKAQRPPWVALRAGARLSVRATAVLSFLVAAELGVAVVRPRFELGASDGSLLVVHEPGVLSGRFVAGAQFHLPSKKG